jgi:predicted MFS family arabinose efflux permease
MPASFLRPALAGAAATCSGNGLARFAYVPLFPALVAAGWVDGGQAGLLGAAALLGYLIGTLSGRMLALWLGVPRALDAAMALILVSLLASAWNGGLWWLLAWRTLAGVAGGFAMALAGPATQASVPAARRGTAGGVVMCGVAFGIGAGALAVPALLGWGIAATWLGLATMVAGLWAFAHPRWPDMALRGVAPAAPLRGAAGRAQGLLLVTWGLHAAGMVPPMVYLADLAARGRGLGVGLGAMTWLVFGAGGLLGGLSGGWFADRVGARRALLAALAVQALALGLSLASAPWLMAPVAFIAGIAAVGVTTVGLAVTREIAPDQAGLLWVRITAAFAVAQTVAGFAMAWLFAATGESHAAVFGTGLVLSALALGAAMLLAARPVRA